jgi:hypothetical protein
MSYLLYQLHGSNPIDRIVSINDQAEYLNRLEYHEFKKLIWDMNDITMYNYQVILDRVKHPMSRIKHTKYDSTLDDILMKDIPKKWYHNSYNANN